MARCWWPLWALGRCWAVARRHLRMMDDALSASDSGCGCLMILFLAMCALGVIFTAIWH